MNAYLKNTQDGDELTIAQLAIANPGAFAVFTKYNIDYCCGGHRSLKDACHRIGLDPEQIRAEINQSPPTDATQSLRVENWSSTLLANFIIENHHGYVRKAIPELEALLDKVCDRHGNDTPELLQIRDAFLDLSEELTTHMAKEEMVLFPAIERLEDKRFQDHPMEKAIQAPIIAMEDDHQLAGDLIKTIRSLSNNYTPPDFACPTFQLTYKKLQEFDNDLMKHIHLENNILFPRYKSTLHESGNLSTGN